MKNILLHSVLMIASMQIALAQTSYTWNGNTSTAFNVSTNWTPNGVPTANDNITIVTGSRNCILNSSSSVKNLTLTSGTFDLGGNTLTVGGTNATFTLGTIQNGTLTISGATTTTFGSSNVTMNCIVNVTSATITITKTIFQNTLTLTKTGSSNDASSGNNIFNGAVIMTNSGSGYLMMGNGNPDQFNSTATFNNIGSNHIYLAYNSSNNIFAGITTFNNAPNNTSGTIYVSWLSANTSFNENIVVTSTNGQGVQFCGGNNTSNATLAALKTISIGVAGFSAGTLLLRQFTQIGSTAQNFTLTGTGNLTFGPFSNFGGNVVASSPTLYMNGAIFSGTTNLTKTGSTGDWGQGGNTFQGVSAITNTGSSYLLMGSTNPDIWNNDVTFTNSGSERLLPAWSSVGNQFNGNIYVNTSGSAQGIQFCGGNNTATALLASGKTIQPGSGGLTVGYLHLKQFIQSGTAPINLTATGTSVLYLGPSSVFGGVFTATAPDIWAQGATYNGRVTFNKTGGIYNHNNQYQNIFNASCTINQQSNTGYFMVGYNSNDLFNDSIIVSSTGTGGIYLGWQPGSTGTPTLAAGKNIYIGSAGFSVGSLNLGGFIQLGSSSGINLTLTGSATLNIYKTTGNCVFNGVFNVTAPNISVMGGTFNNRAIFTKTGGNSNHNQQYQNIFNASCTINQQSNTGYFMLGYNSNELFNDSIIVSSTGTGGIYLGWQPGSTGTPTLAAGKNIYIGSAGFSAGSLNFGGFAQLGSSTGINLTLTGTASLYIFKTLSPSIFNGSFNVTAPDIWVEGATFNAPATFTKTGGSSNHNNQQQNIFNASCTINQQSNTGYFMLGYNSNELFNDSIIVTSTGTGGINLGYTGGTGTPTLASGKSIFIGNAGFSAGSLNLNTFTQLGTVPINLTFSGSTTSLSFARNSVIGGNVITNTPSIYFNGCTFNGTVNATKTGNSSDASSGGNIFNGIVNITNSGAGYVLLGNGNPDQFNAASTFNNTGSNQIYVGYNSSNNIFNGKATFNNTPTANTGIYVSWYSAGTLFNDNIEVTSTFGQGVQFCGASNATVTLAANKTIAVGAGGFSAGTLLLKQFTQLSATSQSLLLTGAGNLTFGPTSVFNGDITSTSGALLLNGCTFNGALNATKTGISGDWGLGGNTFNGVCSLTNSGTSYLLFGGTNPDIWNNDVTFTNNGSERILPAYSSAGNQFNGNIYVNTSGNAQGIQFCGGNNTATATLANSKSIQSGLNGLNAGYLILKQFTQVGSSSTNIAMNSTASYLQFGPSSSFDGNITTSSPGLYFNGCTFNGTVTSVKTGASNDASTGNNVFNGISTFTNSGSGYLLFGNGNRDQFNAASTFNNTGSSQIYVAYNAANNVFGGVTTFNNTPTGNSAIYVGWYSANTTFNDNIIVTSTNGQGVQFCGGNNTATATLVATKTISVGAGGFSAGILSLKQFTQIGNTPQTFTLAGTAQLYFGSTARFDGDVSSSSPSILFNGGTFNRTVNAVKTGSNNDASPGGNTFNSTFTITNTGSGYFLMGNGNPDVFNATATFNNQSTGQHMYVAYNSTGNIFNGDVIFNNQPVSSGVWIYPNYYGINTQFNGNIILNNVAGGGINFGPSTGTATLASGKTITIGVNGFNSGGLIFRNFVQSGSTPQILATTGTSYIQFATGTTFNGDITTSSPGLFFNGSTFNGIVNSTKTGTTNDASTGANVFNGSSTFTNTGTGYLLMTNNTADTYNNDVTFVQSSTGPVYPNYNNNSSYNGNLTITSPSATAITFGQGNGTATFGGSIAQNINATAGTATPVFTRLVINNSAVGGGVTLNSTSINVSNNLTLTSGLLNTSTSYILTMLNASTTAVGTALSTSYVNGPMNYQKSTSGATTLNFPIGNGTDCRPVALTVNHSNGTLYTYQSKLINASANALHYFIPMTVQNVSLVHYYTITRKDASNTSQPTQNLSGNQTIQVFFGANDGISNVSNLTIVKNTYLATNRWIDIGGTNGVLNNGAGSITSTSSPSAFNSFSTFALANSSGGANVLPIELLFFNAQKNEAKVDLTWATATESDNDHFDVERSSDGITFESIAQVKTKAVGGNSKSTLNYNSTDEQPLSGYNYYRLKQFNLDGTFEYSDIVAINFTSDGLDEDEKVNLLNSATDPALSITTPSSWSSSNYSLEIYNEAGQIIKQFENFDINGGGSEVKAIDLNGAEHGFYVAVLTNNSQKRKKTYKIVK